MMSTGGRTGMGMGRVGGGIVLAAALAWLFAACGDADRADAGGAEADTAGVDESGSGQPGIAWSEMQDTTDRVAVVGGLSGPEAVRWDPDQRVWFVSNFGGDAPGDGFVSRVASDGTVESLRFATGDADAPLDDPRGMALVADTLWVADAAGVHGFHRRTGQRLAFVDFRAHDPGFLNDLAVGPDGGLWVTDTGRSRLYRIVAGEAVVALEDPRLGPPNGITWDPDRRRLLLAPWQGVQTLRAWQPGSDTIEDIATSEGGFFDGVEVVDGRAIFASQADSSLHVLDAGARVTRPFVRVAGAPADIGVDREGRRVAVPYIALDRVDVWRLPGGRP